MRSADAPLPLLRDDREDGSEGNKRGCLGIVVAGGTGATDCTASPISTSPSLVLASWTTSSTFTGIVTGESTVVVLSSSIRPVPFTPV